MDPKVLRAGLRKLACVAHELRIPTAEWLLMDCLNIVNCDARELITYLKDNKYITIDLGGWINVTETGYDKCS